MLGQIALVVAPFTLVPKHHAAQSTSQLTPLPPSTPTIPNRQGDDTSERVGGGTFVPAPTRVISSTPATMQPPSPPAPSAPSPVRPPALNKEWLQQMQQQQQQQQQQGGDKSVREVRWLRLCGGAYSMVVAVHRTQVVLGRHRVASPASEHHDARVRLSLSLSYPFCWVHFPPPFLIHSLSHSFSIPTLKTNSPRSKPISSTCTKA